MASLGSLLRTLLLLHQLLKVDYLREAAAHGWPCCGQGNEQNNRNTLDFLRRTAVVQRIGGLLAQVRAITGGADLAGRYRAIRLLYMISPSLHELWFFREHYRLRIEKIVRGRLGLKTLLTARSAGNDRLARASVTYMVKNAILLENLYQPWGLPGMLDTTPPDAPSQACRRLLDRYDTEASLKVTELLGSGILHRGLEVVHGLVRSVGYAPILSGALATSGKWLFYAPCAVNEGPLLLPRDGVDLLGITPRGYTCEDTREMLQQALSVCEYERGTDAWLWCRGDRCSNQELRERIVRELRCSGSNERNGGSDRPCRRRTHATRQNW